jgi:hypothetical protein
MLAAEADASEILKVATLAYDNALELPSTPPIHTGLDTAHTLVTERYLQNTDRPAWLSSSTSVSEKRITAVEDTAGAVSSVTMKMVSNISSAASSSPTVINSPLFMIVVRTVALMLIVSSRPPPLP